MPVSRGRYTVGLCQVPRWFRPVLPSRPFPGSTVPSHSNVVRIVSILLSECGSGCRQRDVWVRVPTDWPSTPGVDNLCSVGINPFRITFPVHTHSKSSVPFYVVVSFRTQYPLYTFFLYLMTGPTEDWPTERWCTRSVQRRRDGNPPPTSSPPLSPYYFCLRGKGLVPNCKSHGFP